MKFNFSSMFFPKYYFIGDIECFSKKLIRNYVLHSQIVHKCKLKKNLDYSINFKGDICICTYNNLKLLISLTTQYNIIIKKNKTSFCSMSRRINIKLIYHYEHTTR